MLQTISTFKILLLGVVLLVSGCNLSDKITPTVRSTLPSTPASTPFATLPATMPSTPRPTANVIPFTPKPTIEVIPTVKVEATIPSVQLAPPVIPQVCAPDSWDLSPCGSQNCQQTESAQCNSEGTGYVCRPNPGLCTVNSGGPIPPPPIQPPVKPGEPPPAPWKCDDGWLSSQINGYLSSNPSVSRDDFIKQYDKNGNGTIDCDDYRQITGQG